MGAFLKATFGEIASYLADYGYQPVPIRPGAKAPMIDDWQAGHPVDYYLPQCADWGTGILTATCPAIDLDIRDRELVRILINLSGDMLGPSPFRIGAPPKALLPFSPAESFEKSADDGGRCQGMTGAPQTTRRTESRCCAPVSSTFAMPATRAAPSIAGPGASRWTRS
jgi:hypothetical protein